MNAAVLNDGHSNAVVVMQHKINLLTDKIIFVSELSCLGGLAGVIR